MSNMTTKGQRRRLAARLVLSIAAVLVASLATADARDGLKRWWKAKDLNGDNRLHLKRIDAAADQVWNYLDYWRFETLWTESNYDSGMMVIIQ